MIPKCANCEVSAKRKRGCDLRSRLENNIIVEILEYYYFLSIKSSKLSFHTVEYYNNKCVKQTKTFYIKSIFHNLN
jgi:hypothetical protein